MNDTRVPGLHAGAEVGPVGLDGVRDGAHPEGVMQRGLWVSVAGATYILPKVPVLDAAEMDHLAWRSMWCSRAKVSISSMEAKGP